MRAKRTAGVQPWVNRLSRSRLVLVAVVLVVFAATASSLPGQAAGPHDEVIVTATAVPVPFRNVARSVQVLTRDEIEGLPVRSVDDLLRLLVGVDVRSRGPSGIQGDLFLRGAGFGQVVVLLNGSRINSTQTGHHSTDIPVGIDEIERVEVLLGPGSSVHGGDALAGVINVITRGMGSADRFRIAGGQFGFFSAGGTWSGDDDLPILLSAWSERSSGFTEARDFDTWGFSSRWISDRTRVDFSHTDKDFGAAGFYGPSPSREWTESTLGSWHQILAARDNFEISSTLAYRRHGDHFLWDEKRPGFAENQHRDHGVELLAEMTWIPKAETRLTFGGGLASDWIDSSNLGDHRYRRSSFFAEAQQPLGANLVIYPGFRLDGYSDFGSNFSPSLSALWWVNPQVKVRSSISRGYRVPSFTERFYTDPNHQAVSELAPERSLGFEAGADWIFKDGLMVSATAFLRGERDVIDWLRSDPSARWHTANVHRIDTRGVEWAVKSQPMERLRLTVQYGNLSLRPEALELEAKYLTDYPRHSLTTHGVVILGRGLEFGKSLSYRRKIDGTSYWVADLRVSKRIGSARFRLDVTNLFDADYQEVNGVDMPPRWIRAGIDFELR